MQEVRKGFSEKVMIKPRIEEQTEINQEKRESIAGKRNQKCTGVSGGSIVTKDDQKMDDTPAKMQQRKVVVIEEAPEKQMKSAFSLL